MALRITASDRLASEKSALDASLGKDGVGEVGTPRLYAGQDLVAEVHVAVVAPLHVDVQLLVLLGGEVGERRARGGTFPERLQRTASTSVRPSSSVLFTPWPLGTDAMATGEPTVSARAAAVATAADPKREPARLLALPASRRVAPQRLHPLAAKSAGGGYVRYPHVHDARSRHGRHASRITRPPFGE